MPEASDNRRWRRWRQWEDATLLAAGFEPKEGGFWHKEGVLFARGAALQYAQRELDDKGEYNYSSSGYVCKGNNQA
jgi:hypothetical protein